MPAIGRIEAPRSSRLLAERLRALIFSGELADGAALPAERDLMASTALSRGSVREALRILEAEGLVATRPGRYGGTVVRRPTDAHLVRHVSTFARGRGMPLEDVLQARELLEPLLAELAARHRTEADLEELAQVSARMRQASQEDDGAAFLRLNVDWHVALAGASRNDLLKAFLASVSELVYQATDREEFTSPEVRRLVLQAHAQVEAAVKARDPEAARRRMARHVGTYSRQAKKLFGLVESPPG